MAETYTETYIIYSIGGESMTFKARDGQDLNVGPSEQSYADGAVGVNSPFDPDDFGGQFSIIDADIQKALRMYAMQEGTRGTAEVIKRSFSDGGFRVIKHPYGNARMQKSPTFTAADPGAERFYEITWSLNDAGKVTYE